MFAVINSEGKVLSIFDTKEACEADMMAMPDFDPLDDKEVIDLEDIHLSEILTDEQKEGLLRSLVEKNIPALKDFVEDCITDHKWYKDQMNPEFEEELQSND